MILTLLLILFHVLFGTGFMDPPIPDSPLRGRGGCCRYKVFPHYSFASTFLANERPTAVLLLPIPNEFEHFFDRVIHYFLPSMTAFWLFLG